MKNRPALVVILALRLFGASESPYQLAMPGYRYEFPRDHFNHPGFQTEWWYYTGNLHTAEGRRFGFELTFFRQGVDREERSTNLWDVRDVWMAHFALSDIDGQRFLHTERFNRSGAGIAGADQMQARVWNGNWQARWRGDRSQELQAVAEGFSFQLSLRSEKPPVIHGANGVSQKAEGSGRASHYISLTRLATSGIIVIDGRRFTVEGLSWMDHEFFTHQLESNQAGWDWLSLQLDDGSEIMLFRLRHKDGSPDPFSAGTYVDPQGRTMHLAAKDFSLAPGKKWTHYPIEWSISVPSLGLEAAVTTRLAQQELTGTNHSTPAYWEGAIDITGTRKNRPLKGAGYLEMTGYTGPVPMIP
jgi:predicted secreted hydrolase